MSRAILIRATRNITVQNGIHFQIWAMTSDPSPSQRSVNQFGPSMPNSADKTVSTKPGSPISIQWNETQAWAVASAQGKI